MEFESNKNIILQYVKAEKQRQPLIVFSGLLEKGNVGKLVEQHYEWCYEETRNILILYPPKIGVDLEKAFTEGEETYEFTDIDNLKYCVDFTKEEEFNIDQNSNKVKVIRLDSMTVDGISLGYMCLCALQRGIQAAKSLRVLSSCSGKLDHVLVKTLEEINDTKLRRELYFYLSKQISRHLVPLVKNTKLIVWPGSRLNEENIVFLCLYRGRIEEIPRRYFGKALVYKDVEKPYRNLELPHTKPKSINNDNNLSYEDAMLIERAIEEQGMGLFEKHTNLEAMIGSSFMLSLRKGYIQASCVVLYCQVKGIVPYGESAFPKTLQVGIHTLPVDVREGFLRRGMLQQKPRIGGEKEWHDKLRMGISIGVMHLSMTGTLGLL
ncbi:hypothetical protein CHS0354_037271 [Potamilus streckersoni]|uniref:Uncharacterized protein n=1 Tax=Potamilus streckersoni TaxID=2493646 RepID=A0AAE0SY29_9BIVA|nr:hypothetical protein CHS0354_037271 [Potamilus streckersoni]